MSDNESAPTATGATTSLLPPRHVVVTGGAGFIGSNLVTELVTLGHRVSVIDDLSTGTAANLARDPAAAEAELITGSVLDADLVDRWLKDADLVFHLAASVGVARVVADPLRSIKTNVDGTENVLAACSRHGCQVVLASSSEVYGKSADFPLRESADRLVGPTSVPRWSYSAAKTIDEHLLRAYSSQGVRGSIVRYFNSYGPRLSKSTNASVVGLFIRRALAGEPILVHGDGLQRRCFTYVADTVRATILAAATPKAQGHAFNVGTTSETAIRNLAELVISATGSSSEIQGTSYEAVYGTGFEDVRRRVPDISRALEILRWRPRVTLPDGVQKTISWWRETAGLRDRADDRGPRRDAPPSAPVPGRPWGAAAPSSDGAPTARRSGRLPAEHEPGPFQPEHLERRHALHLEARAGVRDADPAAAPRRGLMRNHYVLMRLRVRDQVILAAPQERADRPGRVPAAGRPLAHRPHAAHERRVRLTEQPGPGRRPGREVIGPGPELVADLLDAEQPPSRVLGVDPVPECRAEIESVMQVLRLDENPRVKQVSHHATPSRPASSSRADTFLKPSSASASR